MAHDDETPGTTEQPRPDELLLRIPDAAERLGVGRTTLYKLIGDGDLAVVHIGRAVRVPVEELHAFVARRAVTHRAYAAPGFPLGRGAHRDDGAAGVSSDS